MAQQITPLAPSLPATTAIQDPAARRFAQAVQDALNALKSEAGAVESLNKAAAALAGAAGGTPAGIAQWLLTSELYQKLKSEIVAIDVQAKQDLLAEAVARQGAIEQIQAILASIETTPDYDPLVTYAIGDMVTYDGKLYRALLETTGNLPTNITYWEKIGDYASLGEVVSAHALAITDLEYSMYNPAGEVRAEVAARQTLATQMRGTYAGTDITQVTQGLMHSERVARSGAYDAEVAARQSLATKVLGQADPTGLTLAALTSGLIFEEAQVRSDVDGSLAQTIDALEVTMGENIEAAILGEQTVRATNDAALVTAINTAWAFTGATQAVSQSGQNLITNWTAAQANRWSQLEAEVFTAGGQTIRAALAEEATVRANADGSLGAQWTIKTDIDGYISGFGFASTANNANPTSEFIIRADKFAVVMPGYGEHVPFAIGPSGASFVGAQNAGGIAQPFEGWSLGSQSLVTVSDGKVGSSALRLATGLGFPTQTAFVPIDPTKKYRVRFWARPSSTCDGLLYFSLRQAINETGTWGPINSGRAPYKPSGHTRAAHNATYGTDSWGEYSCIWDAADWQAGVKFFRPEFLDNYGGTAGYWEVQGLVVEEATDVESAKDAASAAQTAANTANNTLADIAADNKLTAVEKQSAANEWGIINRERASIRTQADALGIGQELWDYDYVYAVLNDYITPLLQDISSTSAIDGPTFRDKWSYFYEFRQRLLNKMAAVAATKADWSNVSGSGRPENGATVGADSSNLRAGPGVNMVFNGDYTDGLAGTTVGWRSGGNQHTLSRNTAGYIVQGEGTAYIQQPGWNGTAVFDANIWNGQEGQYFAVTPGQRYEVYAYLNTHRCVGRVFVHFLDAAGNQITDALGSEVGYTGSINTISDMRLSHGFAVAPWNAAKALVIVRGYGIDSYDPYVFFSRVYFGMAHAGQTEASPWSPGRGISQITPSNVTTYIANAAIGNAQIGGDIYSDLWYSSGNTQGWYLQRNGNLYCANAYVRGDVEASSLKANTAMVGRANIVNAAVDTLQIAGNAVTVPVHVRPANRHIPNTYTTIASGWMDAGGSTVSIFLSFTTEKAESSYQLIVEIINPSGSVIAQYNAMSNAHVVNLITSSNQVGTYSVRTVTNAPGGVVVFIKSVSLFMIGTKR